MSMYSQHDTFVDVNKLGKWWVLDHKQILPQQNQLFTHLSQQKLSTRFRSNQIANQVADKVAAFEIFHVH